MKFCIYLAQSFSFQHQATCLFYIIFEINDWILAQHVTFILHFQISHIRTLLNWMYNIFSYMGFVEAMTLIVGCWECLFRIHGSHDLQLGICFPEHIFKERHEGEVC